jgi:hypothetical protein
VVVERPFLANAFSAARLVDIEASKEAAMEGGRVLDCSSLWPSGGVA